MQQFKRPPIASALLALLAGLPALAVAQAQAVVAQEAAPADNVVQVTGLRQSVRKAEDIKRSADQVVDSLNAPSLDGLISTRWKTEHGEVGALRRPPAPTSSNRLGWAAPASAGA